jgi:hypothetical protein
MKTKTRGYPPLGADASTMKQKPVKDIRKEGFPQILGKTCVF